MRQLMKAGLIAMMFAMPAAWAQNASPAGVWKTIDDETGKPKSLVRITEENGVLTGKIDKLFRPADQDQNPKCTACEGARKDQPIVGMTILWGLKKDGNEYTGGEILDPSKGKTYKSKLSLKDNGSKLDVRGYIGAPMFGRTQTWVREQ
ncbi:DUF2147 domain-containing protein [Massilia sp. IC2-477]|uniref:DUF2147 domain-containing protein n=1 Tax=unclassified Massilia TaxID=2609279 RepID=UPI001D121328|nr:MULTISPECIES: DUF2147 domain-containing protein [unclassified Massilia]MCC2958077.1 DUF2147 domain-containing protein [Massilia sp. IC2-477]MCC2971383.1 DUF2147 domain-containing protein [Massilia sp. IC2-476]